LNKIIYEKFISGARDGASAMSDFNNDDVPSGNPSPRTVLIVLGCVVLAIAVFQFHAAFGF
jgi:hypothetical protein